MRFTVLIFILGMFSWFELARAKEGALRSVNSIAKDNLIVKKPFQRTEFTKTHPERVRHFLGKDIRTLKPLNDGATEAWTEHAYIRTYLFKENESCQVVLYFKDNHEIIDASESSSACGGPHFLVSSQLPD